MDSIPQRFTCKICFDNGAIAMSPNDQLQRFLLEYGPLCYRCLQRRTGGPYRLHSGMSPEEIERQRGLRQQWERDEDAAINERRNWNRQQAKWDMDLARLRSDLAEAQRTMGTEQPERKTSVSSSRGGRPLGQNAERDEKIYRARQMGTFPKALAKEHTISVSRIQQIVREQKAKAEDSPSEGEQEV